jgi:glycosyltransferase involved in cell wall biosynthesis
VPRVSVLMPVRDEAPFLAEALASLSAQTFDDFEVIVVDDGSVDGSGEIAESHGDQRVRVVRQERAGIVVALERARADARGDIVARMDGDDVALPRRLALQVDALAELDAVGGGIEYFPDPHEGSVRYAEWINALVTPELAARDVFVECPLPHPALAVRRDMLDAVGGYRDCGWPEDYDLVLRLWSHDARFCNVPELVLRWRDHGARASRSDSRYALNAFTRCKVHHLRRTLLRGRDVVVWGAGPVGKSFAQELAAQRVRVAAFVDVDPRKIGRRIYGAPVFAPDDAPRDGFAIGAVAGPGPRAEIRAVVAAQGRRDGEDFIAVA